MITVRFSSGVAVTYNDANVVRYYTDRIELLHKTVENDRFYRAAIPIHTGCLIEWKEPCKVTGPVMPSVKAALELVLADLVSGNIEGWSERLLLADVKKHLQRFNARLKVWKKDSAGG